MDLNGLLNLNIFESLTVGIYRHFSGFYQDPSLPCSGLGWKVIKQEHKNEHMSHLKFAQYQFHLH